MKQLKIIGCPLCEEVVALYGNGSFNCCGPNLGSRYYGSPSLRFYSKSRYEE